MSGAVALRLGAFAGALALAFAGAFAIGSAVDPIAAADPAPHTDNPAMPEMNGPGMDESGEAQGGGHSDPAAQPPGLAVSQAGYTLVPATTFFQPGKQERIDRRAHAVLRFHHRRFRPHGRLKRPERAIGVAYFAIRLRIGQRRLFGSPRRRAGKDPGAQQLDLGLGQRLFTLGGHIAAGNHLQQQAFIGLARRDRRAAIAPGEHREAPS